MIGTPLKYRIIKNERDYTNIKQEISKLHKKIDIQYYLKHPEEYEQSREEITKINTYIEEKEKNEKRAKELTVNERSYQIFKDEKRLKEQEKILKKLGITFKELNCYETYEPFFYFENSNYDQFETNKNSQSKNNNYAYFDNKNNVHKTKKVLIIENKDTFWTYKKIAKKYNNIYLVIYGEGKKILNSFEYIKNFELEENTEILYFGDIDYEGINIYISLARKYKNYHILPYCEAYQRMMQLEDKPNKIKHSQNIRKDNIEEFIKYFEEEEERKLQNIFENNLYIPQEIINYEEVEKIIWTN